MRSLSLVLSRLPIVPEPKNSRNRPELLEMVALGQEMVGMRGDVVATQKVFRIQESEFRIACEYASINLLLTSNIAEVLDIVNLFYRSGTAY